MRKAQTGQRAPLSKTLAASAAILLQAALPLPNAVAQESVQWLGTWSASPQPVWEPDFFAAVPIPRSLRDQSIRQEVRVSQGGEAFRVEFSNRYGEEPLSIGRAGVALPGEEDGAIDPSSARALTFSGSESFSVPAGALVWSDPVDMPIEDLETLVVSLYLPQVTPLTTWHNDARQTAWISANGDFTDAARFDAAQTFDKRFFLSGVQVRAEGDPASVVLFGDSITDGDGSSLDENNRWPDVLAERLVESGSALGVLNEGISGARLLADRMGDNALARFDSDVLTHPHAETLVIMMGINDIGWPDSALTDEGEPEPSVEALIDAYEQLIARARMHGLKTIGATLTPFEGAFEGGPLEGYYNERKEEKRAAVNEWIRESGAFDAVIDFDAVVRDPENPRRIKAEFDKGDHLHPNDAGYRAMAESIDLDLLSR